MCFKHKSGSLADTALSRYASAMTEDISYKDWQVSTLMLAYDLVDPIARTDIDLLTERQQAVEDELWQMIEATLPKDFLENPTRDFPPEVVAMLTRATLARAARIAGVFPDQQPSPE